MKVSLDTLFWSCITASCLTVFLCAAVDEFWPAPDKEPQLYTVHFDGIDHQDLKLMWTESQSKTYRTKTGKRIQFHGKFYEVEQ